MTPVSSPYAVGVDGYAGGWVAVALDRPGHLAGAWAAGSLQALLSPVPAGSTVGVDIPLGLLDTGWRSADRATAARLGRRRSSVFAVPPRPVWGAASHAEANVACRQLTGGGFSAQAWGLRTKVLEADAYREDGRHELIEVHPELVFTVMTGAPMAEPKKSWNGHQARRGALAAAGVVLPDDLGPAALVPLDDVLDAAAVAWCAHRYRRGRAAHEPDPIDQYDHRGRPIAVWS